MPQASEMLSKLLANEDNAKRFLELATALSAQNTAPAANPPPAPQSTQPAQGTGAPDMQQIIASLLAQRGEGHSQGAQGSDAAPPVRDDDETPAEGGAASNFSVIAEMLPQLLQAMNGDGSTLPSEKVNLVQAIRPYAGGRANSIDRAVKMAGIAKAAKSALSILGRR